MPVNGLPYQIEQIDFADFLPPDAAKVMHDYRFQCEEFIATESALNDKVNAARVGIGNAQRRIAHLERDRLNVDETHAGLIEARKELAALEGELARLLDRRNAHVAVAAPLHHLRQSLETFLKDKAPSYLLVPYSGPVPKAIKGETLEAGILRTQSRAREISSRINEVIHSQYPKSMALELATTQIDRLAQRAEPYVAGLLEQLREIEFTTVQVPVDVLGAERAGTGTVKVTDALGLMCWFFRDEMLAKISANLDRDVDPNVPATTPLEKRNQERALRAELLAFEREEISLIAKARAVGGTFEIRPETSPLAVLGIQLAEKPEDGPIETSRQHAARTIVMAGRGRAVSGSSSQTPPMERTASGHDIPPAGR